MIYVIEKHVLDNSENESARAITRELVAATKDHAKANEFVSRGRQFTEADCWAIRSVLPEYVMTAIGEL